MTFIKEIFFPMCIISLCSLAIWGFIYGVYAFFQVKECKIWGGTYSISTGCLVEYKSKVLTLQSYKNIQATEALIQPEIKRGQK